MHLCEKKYVPKTTNKNYKVMFFPTNYKLQIDVHIKNISN